MRIIVNEQEIEDNLDQNEEQTLFEGLGDIQDLGSTVPMKQIARKSIIAPVVPTLQQKVEVLTFQAAAQVAASLATKASELGVPVQLKWVRTKTIPNTRREQFKIGRAHV